MIKEIDIKKLNEAPYNPRVALSEGMPEFEKLRKSIEAFGNVEPIVWNKATGNVVGGHQRLAVLKAMGEKKVPCMVVELDEKDEKVLNLALNKIKGQWDYTKLEEILSGFSAETIDATGFTADEVALYLSGNEDGITEGDIGDYIEEEGDVTSNFVVTLKFEERVDAQQWIDEKGLDGEVRERAGTTVIRME